MNEETLLRETLRHWSEQTRVPADLADRVLDSRRRRRLPALAVTAVTVAAVLVAGMFVLPGAFRERPAPAADATVTATVSPPPPDVQTDTENDPPRTLIAAGQVAVSAYSTLSWVPTGRGTETVRWHWSLYNPVSGQYEPTDWSWVDVAPGLRFAAVIEGDLPARRVGVFDMNTRQVVRWIGVEQGAGAAYWSPDGTRILITTYSGPPDELRWLNEERTMSRGASASRTGFAIADASTGQVAFRSFKGGGRRPGFPPNADNADNADGPSGRRDFRWSEDGTLIWEPQVLAPAQAFYDLEGNSRPAPPDRMEGSQLAGVSPNRRLIADRGRPPGPETTVKDLTTGEIVGTQKMLQLIAWADDGHLIALGCAGACENEFSSALMLVSVDGRKVVQLSSYRSNTNDPDVWDPLLTIR
ncbi:hypothetical protein Aph01nite_36990 [Acrocarpospora phusangensis]|uniref:Uncharacterized protein n=1 Tax=Acrocarpospora phusangensis TaxID=1070424 RepID=A0A919QCV6_9ACTN|nr:hypothetical protein [Acrocarpospora phusangensis]GIH25389.1 hypothetical protein Aph01nite_36990 [Acrocarpospora phusangensis]